MSAIISDKFRVLNAEVFLNSIFTQQNKIYSFIAQPNSTNPEVGIGRANWGFGPAPLDNIDQENKIKETIIALKKITYDDVRRLIRKLSWEQGQIYEMYRHDYSVYNLSPQTNSSSLYESNFYVVNKNYRVYICLNNGVNTSNPFGRQSIDEPDFVDLEPRPAGTSGDGYIWKYLYTISPSDIIKFDSESYIPLPNNWGELGTESFSIKNNAVDGKIESVVVQSRGIGYSPRSSSISGIPILGDGREGEVTVIINSFGEVEDVIVTNGGYGYSKGIIELVPGAPGVPLDLGLTEAAEFDVIIPPKGGHGYDIYRELGAYKVMLYSRFETDSSNPDVIVGNDFSIIGLLDKPNVKSDLAYVTGLKGLKLTGVDAVYTVDEKIYQNIGAGKTAVGYVASWDNDTKILKYYQTSGSVGEDVDYVLYDFTSTPEAGGSLTIINSGGTSLNIDTTFNDSVITLNSGKVYNLGSNYIAGISSSEYVKGTGDLIYVDARQPIIRSLSQKEDVKIILEF